MDEDRGNFHSSHTIELHRDISGSLPAGCYTKKSLPYLLPSPVSLYAAGQFLDLMQEPKVTVEELRTLRRR